MHPPSDQLLHRLAARIADEDESPVPDWSALAIEHREHADSIRILAALAGLASAHRTAHRGADAVERESTSPSTRRKTRAMPFDWGQFEVREWIGCGGEGDIYRAFDRKLRREVALKLQPAPRADSIDEARNLARVRHPNVLAVHGVDVVDGVVGHWTDLLRGQTLEERLRFEGTFSEIEAIWIGLDLCRALAAVHDAGLIHGDVKTSNVMREDDGTTVLLDFGAAQVLSFDAGELRRATPMTAAPEVLDGMRATTASDLYSLAVLLYRLVSGAYPFAADDLASLVEAHRRGRAQPLRALRPDLSERFCRVVEQGLAPRAEDRFDGAPVFASALIALLTPRARTRDERRADHNLKVDPSRFIGRAEELARLRNALEHERMVVITGAGGSGKTRLASRLAMSLVDVYSEIRWVDLQSLRRASAIAPAIAAVLGLRESPGQSWIDLLLERLRDRRALLVLDNCEHLRSGCAGLTTRLLERAPLLSIVATSRERLRTRGELVFPLAPLALPASDVASPHELEAFDSIALFLDRARKAGAEITLDQKSGPLVARICRRLDGLPLAIELAAARVRGLALSQLYSKLESSFRLLTGDGIPRHRTLAATLEWSYALLTKREQALVRRLSIFEEGWTLESAEAVTAFSPLQRKHLTDLLSRLVEKSLVESDTQAEVARYRFLETIRAFAFERLAESDELAKVAATHRDFYLALAREAGSNFRTPKEGLWAKRVAADAANLRAAFERALDDQFDLDAALLFAVDLARFAHARGAWSESRSIVQRMLARVVPGHAPTSTLFDITVHGGYTAADLSLREEAAILIERAHDIAVGLGDRARLAVSYGYLGNLAIIQGNLAEAKRCQEHSLALNTELSDDRRIGICHSNLGNIAEESGDLVSARRHHDASLAFARRAGDLRSAGYTLGRLGDTNLIEGRFEDALECYRESRAIREELGDQWGVATCLSGIGEATLRLGRIEEARTFQDAGVELMREVGDRFSLVRLLMRIASGFGEGVAVERARTAIREALSLALAIGDRVDLSSLLVLTARLDLGEHRLDRAPELLGAADRILREIEASFNPTVEEERRDLRERLTRILGAEESRRRGAAGDALDDAEAVKLALRP